MQLNFSYKNIVLATDFIQTQKNTLKRPYFYLLQGYKTYTSNNNLTYPYLI
jgi:hypothetical protein